MVVCIFLQSSSPRQPAMTTPCPTEPTHVAPSRGSNYTVVEDVALCRAYVAVTEDGAVGVNQTGKTFWMKVLEKFETLCVNVNRRNIHGLNNRWIILSHAIGKYVEFLSFYHRNAKSGEQNDVDVARHAHAEYVVQMRKVFNHDECYEVVKCIPKFNYLLIAGNGSQPSDVEGVDSNPNTTPFQGPGFLFGASSQPGDSSSQPQSMEEVQRPPGQRKKKAKSSASSSSVESIIEETNAKFVEAFNKREERRAAVREKELAEFEKSRLLREEELQIQKNEEADRKMKMADRKMELQMRQQEIILKMREEEDRIMGINTDNMPTETRNYWLQRKQEIMERRRPNRRNL